MQLSAYIEKHKNIIKGAGKTTYNLKAIQFA